MGRKSRVLVIGDLHEPFCLDGYLKHCKKVYKQYDCNRVVFIGDVIDNHYSSYHETDPNGMGGKEELEYAIKRIKRWYKAFPKAEVLIGNHDRIVMRKAFSSKVPSEWIKDYHEVLNTPEWDFKMRTVIDGVQYVHGESGTAKTKAKNDLMSTVQGHLHTQLYTEWFSGIEKSIFGCQVGCGINKDAYAFAYAKGGKTPQIGCAVVLNGKTCINEVM